MRAILVARGVVGLWFGSRIFAADAPLWGAAFDLLTTYLLIDGALGVVLALLSFREATVTKAQREWTLAFVLLADGVGRLLSGIGVHIWPGLPGFPVSLVVAISIMAACTAAVGLVEFTLVAEEEVARHGPKHNRPQISAGPTAVASLVAILFGVFAVISIGDPERARRLIAGYAVSAGIAMWLMAWARRKN
jgi:hypothetical protein